MKLKENLLKKILKIEMLCIVFLIGFAMGGFYVNSQFEDIFPSEYSFVSWKDGYNDAINGFNYSYHYYPDGDPENTGFQDYYYAGYRSGECNDWKVMYFNLTTLNVQNNRNCGDIITSTEGIIYKFYNINHNYEKLEPGKNYTIGLTVWHPNSTNPEIGHEIISVKHSKGAGDKSLGADVINGNDSTVDE